ncbi:hypothetical protein ACK3SF_00125 [Candidatus Nanosalina sp. VS9-1]|uniref:hypothetical protein n=1 Tax=Candidatus Nanosalina sp. VS9-1 TaxID=3388566 RepID=UPI0039E114A0
MAEKNKTISFRVQEQQFDEMKDIAEDLDTSVSKLMRDHVEGMADDPLYREVHMEFYDDDRDFEAFVDDEDYFDTEWVDQTAVDYDKMLEKFHEVKYRAERQEMDEAYRIIDEMKEEGFEREAFLLNSITAQYRE